MAYFIENNCIACSECLSVCSDDAISAGKPIFVIDPLKCTDCDMCSSICPVSAITIAPCEPLTLISFPDIEEDEDVETDEYMDFGELLSKGLHNYISNEKNAEKIAIEDKLSKVYKDPEDRALVAETLEAINTQIQKKLHPRKFLWGKKEEIEEIARYIVANSEQDFDKLCDYILSHSLHFDKNAFRKELNNFNSASFWHLYHRNRVEKYIYIDRLDTEEILQLIEDSIKETEEQKYKTSAHYYDKIAFIREMETDEILQLMDELNNELLNRGIDINDL